MFGCIFTVSKKSRALRYNIDSEIFPAQLCGIFNGRYGDRFPIHLDHVIFCDDIQIQPAVNGIVFE